MWSSCRTPEWLPVQLSDVWGLLRLSSVLRLLRTGVGAVRNAVGAVVSRPLSAAQVPKP